MPVKLIIIYTADVKKGTTNPVLDLDWIEMRITEAFLSSFKSEDIWDEISGKADSWDNLSDEDMMKLIIYPLTFKGNKAKQEAVGRVIDLAKNISDREKMVFALKMVWTFSDKFISDADAEKIKEVFTMTKVDRLLAEDKRKAVEKAVGVAVEENTKTVTEKVTNNVSTHIAENMLIDGDPIEKVSKNTGLSLATVKNLLKSIEQKGVRIATL